MNPRPTNIAGIYIKDGEGVKYVTVFFSFVRLSERNDECALGGPSEQARLHPEATRSARRPFQARPGIASKCCRCSLSLRLCSDVVFSL